MVNSIGPAVEDCASTDRFFVAHMVLTPAWTLHPIPALIRCVIHTLRCRPPSTSCFEQSVWVEPRASVRSSKFAHRPTIIRRTHGPDTRIDSPSDLHTDSLRFTYTPFGPPPSMNRPEQGVCVERRTLSAWSSKIVHRPTDPLHTSIEHSPRLPV